MDGCHYFGTLWFPTCQISEAVNLLTCVLFEISVFGTSFLYVMSNLPISKMDKSWLKVLAPLPQPILHVTSGYDPGLSVSHFCISRFRTTLVIVSLNQESSNSFIQCHVFSFQPTARISLEFPTSRVWDPWLLDTLNPLIPDFLIFRSRRIDVPHFSSFLALDLMVHVAPPP